MNKILLIKIGIFLLINISCSPSIYETKISDKEQESGIYSKEIITINGHSYLETHQNVSKISHIRFTKQNQSIAFSAYSSSLDKTIKDINKDGQKDLLLTSQPFLSNYKTTDIVLADENGVLNFKRKYKIYGYYPMEKKSFGYVYRENACKISSVKEFVLCNWTNTGYENQQYCYFNRDTKECLCFPKKLDDCESLEDWEQKRNKDSLVEISKELQKAIDFWRF